MILCWFFISITFLLKIFAENPSSCKTPNGEEALCLSLFSCPVLKQALVSEDPSVQKFFEQSDCGNGKYCCGTSGNFMKPSEDAKPINVREEGRLPMESKRDYVIRKLLPNEKYCGLQHSDDFSYMGNTTSVYDFPWLVYITIAKFSNYATKRSGEIRTTGVIINNRYVLTTSRLDTLDVEQTVKLGRYHRFKDFDCMGGNDTFGLDCTEPPLELAIAEKFRTNDQLLIRLNDTLSYTDFIRPICLPLDESKRPKPGDLVVISGWGDVKYADGNQLVKKRLNHTLVNNEDCINDFKSSNPMCVKAQNSDYTACSGDEGGPLMYKSKFSWFVEGIIIGIPHACDEEVHGARLTQEVLNWMFEHMYP